MSWKRTSGCLGRRAVAVEVYIILQGAQVQPVRVKLGAEDVARASSMGQQLMDRHLRSDIFVGIIGQVLPTVSVSSSFRACAS